MLWIASLCLGALAGIAFAYFSLQYSIDLQKLVGLRGRYATVSVELQQIKEKKALESEQNSRLSTAAAGSDGTPSDEDFANVALLGGTGPT